MDRKASGPCRADRNPFFMVGLTQYPHMQPIYKAYTCGKMKSRYTDRRVYFDELAQTSREFITRYVSRFMDMRKGKRVLEIGCGEGGNLVPFAEAGLEVYGVDISSGKIAYAREFFHDLRLSGTFICEDFLNMDIASHISSYDLIILHDVIEHIDPSLKGRFMLRARQLMKTGGIMMVGFPSWKMPFGGHQQICSKRICRIPFIHLLPSVIYRKYLEICGEKPEIIAELMSIFKARMSIEGFEKLLASAGYMVKDRTLWLINPHYKAKFGLKPRKLPVIFCRLRWFRDHMCTSCFYILTGNTSATS
jgi:SAM-dependent methyltransferase